MSLKVEPADGRIVRPTTRASCVVPVTFEGDLVAGLHAAAVEGVGTQEHVVERAEGLTGEHRRRDVAPQPLEADRADLAQLDAVGADPDLAGAQERGPGHPSVARQSLGDGCSLVRVERQAHLEVPAGPVPRRRRQQARHAGGDDECSHGQRHAGRRRGHRGNDRQSVPALAGVEREAGPGRGHGRHAQRRHGPGDRADATRRRPGGGTAPTPGDGGRHRHDHRRRHEAAEHRHGHVDPDAPTDLGPPRRSEGEHQRPDRSERRPRWAPTAQPRRRPAASRLSSVAGGSCRARRARQDRTATGPGAGCTRGRRGRCR